ncbi:threonine--tRNA ligase [Thermospira aquatica]|uniref:Threonine--tRNA ligase n=1 Tax=Thermospira aquatica TaxID=2828656 RepID=A0AAX3BAV1_9SPIR|nr:threonine--tRNA ligase [Thermospira aquatica]URA09395.1 threonine--tRNA ligase [Thermospira aquatica]
MQLLYDGRKISLDVQDGFGILKYYKEHQDEATREGIQPILSQVIALKVNGELADLRHSLSANDTVEMVTLTSVEGLDIMRHTASHIMAQAALRLYPGAKLGVGPTIENGFYYDILFDRPLGDEDLRAIEAEMKKIVDEKLPVVREEMSRADALAWCQSANQPFKAEIIHDLEGERFSFYRQGEFVDLCRGPHLPNTRFLKAFKLLHTAGAYWRGDEKNPMLTRIYGTAFATKEDLENYLYLLEETKKRDHRRLGKELGLFSFHEEGPGLPFWKPKGVILKNTLIEFMRAHQRRLGYVEVETPTMLKDDLWRISGHMENFKENMFFFEKDGENYAIKPMNCPGGMLMYKEELHSYRDLPLKVAEFGKVHRYERSGVLQGLFRVRGFTQDDAHIFTTPETLKDAIREIIQLVDVVYKTFGFEYSTALSTRPEKSMGTDQQWELATNSLKAALDEFGVSYKIQEGEGAFYGPKIEYHLKDALGRTHQCGTIQLDMNLPERFDLTYVGEDGKPHRVIMLHRAILGSLERFIAILIEHYGGKFPFWLAPVQVAILPVSERFLSYAKEVKKVLERAGIRVSVDTSDEKLGYKIRQAQLEQIPYMVIVGEKEVENQQLSVRHRDEGDKGSMSMEFFVSQLEKENRFPGLDESF